MKGIANEGRVVYGKEQGVYRTGTTVLDSDDAEDDIRRFLR